LGSARSDIGDEGWKIFANESDVKVNFNDNGNDPGPCANGTGNANDILMLEVQGGRRKELANAVESRPGILHNPELFEVCGNGRNIRI